MRILAVDPGTVRLGLAISDELGMIASPLEALERVEGIRRDAARVARLAEDLSAELILVGYALEEDGTEGSSAAMCRQFAERIGRYTKLPVQLVDERYTSFEAGERLKQAGVSSKRQRALVDSQAAAVLLEDYLKSQEH